MNIWCFLLLGFFLIISVNGAVVPDSIDIEHQGLYSKSDHVTILTNENFDRKVYGQKNAYLIQFYNSYCGHCRGFAPKFKSLAADVAAWKNVIKLGVIDCSVEENNEICRQFEVMAYPSLRYLHEDYKKGNAFVGDKFQLAETAEKLKTQVISKMQIEQSLGRLSSAPHLNIAAYESYIAALTTVPNDIIYAFLIFENENSTVGSELALDISDYEHIGVLRVYENSELATIAGVTRFPALVAISSTREPTQLTPENPTKQNLIRAVNTFLQSKNYALPARDIEVEDNGDNYISKKKLEQSRDIVYYEDLEKTLKTSLHTEITRHKVLSGEALQALIDYLNVLIVSFPSRYNLKEYLVDLSNTLAKKQQWSGSDIYKTVKSLENAYDTVFSPEFDYKGCRGSQPQYRGYTCGLWTLFHTLTVNAAQLPGLEGPKVLKAMHGYVKHFFGCTDCSRHFQSMAARNRIFDVKENDKAVLWLWISHNEVNLRLAGDVTEDPEHPKIQFPSANKCPECRQARGAWNLLEVYQYLQNMYRADKIQDSRGARSSAGAQSPLSNLDIGMLSLLYIFSFLILILVIKYFLSKRFFRKRRYKHAWGKV